MIATATPRFEQLRQRFERAFARAHHQDGYVMLATNFGQALHPGWYHNLVAHPDREIPVVLVQPAAENPGSAER